MIDQARGIGQPSAVRGRTTPAGSDGAQEIPAASPESPRIWSFAAGGKWRRVPDPIPWPEGELNDAQMEEAREEAGWIRLAGFGVEHGRFEFALYEHHSHDRFLVELCCCDTLFSILAEGLPGLLGLLGLLLPLAQADTSLQEAEDRWAERSRIARRRGR
jgi:hypothetical protein